MHKLRFADYVFLARIATALLIFSCANVVLAASTFELQSVVNRANSSASAANSEVGFSNDGPYLVEANPAYASATATSGGDAAHGEAYAAYDESPYELYIIGSGNASASVSDGGDAGHGIADFTAAQYFGPDPVLVQIVGTLYLNESHPINSAAVVSFYMGSYLQTLSENGTLTFDDLVMFNGNLNIVAELYEAQPSAIGSGSFSGSASYEVTLTIIPSIVPEPSTATQLAVAVGAMLCRRSRR